MCALAGHSASDQEAFWDRWYAYDDQLGRRLPMTAFEELVLNETSGIHCIMFV